MNGGKDLNKYRLGTLKTGSAVYKNLVGDKSGSASRNIMVAVKDTVHTPKGPYYEIVSDNKEYNSIYVEVGSVNLINSY